jgi:hypothetical protein
LFEERTDGTLGLPKKQLLALLRVDETDYELIKAYKDNSMAKVLKGSTNQAHIEETEEKYLTVYGKVYVPTSQVHRIVTQAHDLCGHQGYQRT